MVIVPELTHDRVAHWVKCENNEDVIKTASQTTMLLAEAEVAKNGYQIDSERPATTQVVNQHTDFFVQNKVAVITEIPVLLTRKQWLERHLPPVERELEAARHRMMMAIDGDAYRSAKEDIDHYAGVVESYKAELASL